MRNDIHDYAKRMNEAIEENRANLQSHYGGKNIWSFVRDCGYALNDFPPEQWPIGILYIWGFVQILCPDGAPFTIEEMTNEAMGMIRRKNRGN